MEYNIADAAAGDYHNNHSAQDNHPNKECVYCTAEEASQKLGIEKRRQEAEINNDRRRETSENLGTAMDKVGDFNMAPQAWKDDGTNWPRG